LESTKENLINNYLADQRPWVVAFSGGKDSTLVLQLVYEMLLDKRVKVRKPIYIISSDTLVEPPNISSYLSKTLELIKQNAQALNLAINVNIVTPSVEERFWSKIIGKGYPTPTWWFRWCTSYMKIRPSRRAIAQITRKHGSVILLLGTRYSESSSRLTKMKGRQYNERGLNPHNDIPNALVFSPIENWKTDDVWEYLFKNNPPPWGGNHDFMLNLYRQASGGECPIILNINTPSCGGSRFGCWTCTVVKEDKAMKGFVETGEGWMEPLQDFRSWIKGIREDPSMRMNKRRNKTIGQGPFTPEARKMILLRLLKTEKEVKVRLISDEEISYIQTIWSKEFDLEFSAYKISKKYGREVIGMENIEFSQEEQQILDSLVSKYEVSPELIYKLIELVKIDYPNIDFHGAKAGLERAIKETIELDIRQEELVQLSL